MTPSPKHIGAPKSGFCFWTAAWKADTRRGSRSIGDPTQGHIAKAPRNAAIARVAPGPSIFFRRTSCGSPRLGTPFASLSAGGVL